MSEVISLQARLAPLPLEPITISGISLSVAPSAAVFSLRAKDAALLSRTIALPLPQKIGETLGGIAMLGPDEWLAMLPAGTTLPPCPIDAPLAIVDISNRAIALTLTGERAWAALGAGCPLDVERFAICRTTRTLFESIEIIAQLTSESSFTLIVWRSFAPWLWHALSTSAATL
jgi:sarcosine oxidase, subunit gamma